MALSLEDRLHPFGCCELRGWRGHLAPPLRLVALCLEDRRALLLLELKPEPGCVSECSPPRAERERERRGKKKERPAGVGGSVASGAKDSL
ncbi:hypothetical protein chiPu_0017026 [Chiloscyllium punctatum]|uniref:Uncharacterized protein n=1 Tax=Chiloscyllium punctatum TaxID=137246 RepID=A0A401T7B6_CHIPU|nr:hypothetical protein [Chiloscyllium punctatum]